MSSIVATTPTATANNHPMAAPPASATDPGPGDPERFVTFGQFRWFR